MSHARALLPGGPPRRGVELDGFPLSHKNSLIAIQRMVVGGPVEKKDDRVRHGLAGQWG